MADPTLCAFCALPKAQVRRLIAGDALGTGSVGICERCVGTCYDMLVKDGTLAARAGAAAAAPAAAAPMDAASAIRAAVRAMPRSVDVRALGELASAGLALANGNAAQLRSLAYELGNAMAFEHALEVRSAVAAFERNASDALSDLAYLTRLGRAREALDVVDRAARLTMTPGEQVGMTLGKLYARLAGTPWDAEVRSVEGELAAIAPRLPTLGLDASFLRALQNQVVHIRARAALAAHRDADAVRILSAQLVERELDIEALALIVEAYERTGDRASATRAKEKALQHVPKNSAYAKRITSGR